MSPVIGAYVPKDLEKLVLLRFENLKFKDKSEYLRWLIREDLQKAGLLGERMNETKSNQPQAAERLRITSG